MQAENAFGKKYQAIVSGCDFSYVNYYAKKMCKMQLGTKYIMAWAD
jgi:hypothetical protein